MCLSISLVYGFIAGRGPHDTTTCGTCTIIWITYIFMHHGADTITKGVKPYAMQQPTAIRTKSGERIGVCRMRLHTLGQIVYSVSKSSYSHPRAVSTRFARSGESRRPRPSRRRRQADTRSDGHSRLARHPTGGRVRRGRPRTLGTAGDYMYDRTTTTLSGANAMSWFFSSWRPRVPLSPPARRHLRWLRNRSK